MKKTLVYIILFLGLVSIIDFGIGLLLKKSFHEITYGDYGTINRGLETKTDILILGSSRAQHHYNPDILKNTLNNSCFNAGLGGHGLFYNYAFLNEVIKTKKPKVVLLDISPNIIVDPQAYTKLNILLPYYNKFESFQEIIQLDPKFSKLELVSNLYVYNSTVYDLLRSSISKNNPLENGFKPLEGEIHENNFDPFYLKKDEKMDNNKMIYLSKIIDLCKKNDIKLFGIVSPTYKKFDTKNRIIHKIDSIFKQHSLPLYNYSNYERLYNKSIYFKDQLHLNSDGSTVFSNEIARLLSSNI